MDSIITGVSPPLRVGRAKHQTYVYAEQCVTMFIQRSCGIKVTIPEENQQLYEETGDVNTDNGRTQIRAKRQLYISKEIRS